MNQFLPLNYLNHYLYCPRRFWYMYVCGEIAINAPMLEGSLQHATRVDQPGHETDDHGRVIHRRLWLWSDRHQIAGFADLVERDPHSQQLIPVEYKHGRKGKWDNDQVQLCAQALCLEEMMGNPVDQGEIFYASSRRRITVSFDSALRQLTQETIGRALQLRAATAVPHPISEKQKCTHCSLEPICLPAETRQLVGS